MLNTSPSVKQGKAEAPSNTAAALDATPIIAGEVPQSGPAESSSRDSLQADWASADEAIAAPQPVLGAVAAALTGHRDEIQPDKVELQESEDMLSPLEVSAEHESQPVSAGNVRIVPWSAVC